MYTGASKSHLTPVHCQPVESSQQLVFTLLVMNYDVRVGYLTVYDVHKDV